MKNKIIDGERGTAILLAKKIGVTQPYMSNLINNKVAPSLSLLQKIADVLAVSITDLFVSDDQIELTALIEHNGSHYKALSLSDLKEIITQIEDNCDPYYNLWRRSDSDRLRELSGGGIRKNDMKFLEELNSKSSETDEELDLWFRALLVFYVTKRAADDTDYLLEYYTNWLSHTKFLTKKVNSRAYSWCCDYENFILTHHLEKVIL